jgi:hypothetical protein
MSGGDIAAAKGMKRFASFHCQVIKAVYDVMIQYYLRGQGRRCCRIIPEADSVR